MVVRGWQTEADEENKFAGRAFCTQSRIKTNQNNHRARPRARHTNGDDSHGKRKLIRWKTSQGIIGEAVQTQLHSCVQSTVGISIWCTVAI